MAIGTLGMRLKELRQNKRLSQGQIAQYAGISQSSLSDVENGKIAPKTLDALKALAHYYQVSTDYLLGLTDDPDPQRAENRAQEAALLAQLPGPERAIVRALLLVLARETPGERQFTLEVIERLLLPAQPHIIGEEPDEPTERYDSPAPPAQPAEPA